MGIPREKSDLLVDAFNDMDRRAMLEVADVYDPAIPATENPTYVAPCPRNQGALARGTGAQDGGYPGRAQKRS